MVNTDDTRRAFALNDRELRMVKGDRPTLEELRAIDARRRSPDCQKDWACYLGNGHPGKCARD